MYRSAAPSLPAPVISGPLTNPLSNSLDLFVRKKKVLKGQSEGDHMQLHNSRLTRGKKMHILGKTKNNSAAIYPLLNIAALIARDLFFISCEIIYLFYIYTCLT